MPNSSHRIFDAPDTLYFFNKKPPAKKPFTAILIVEFEPIVMEKTEPDNRELSILGSLYGTFGLSGFRARRRKRKYFTEKPLKSKSDDSKNIDGKFPKS